MRAGTRVKKGSSDQICPSSVSPVCLVYPASASSASQMSSQERRFWEVGNLLIAPPFSDLDRVALAF